MGDDSAAAPTISRVATEAGVSRATVSRAFTRPEMLSPQTVARVRAIANRFTAAWHDREEELQARHAEVQRAVWQAERDDDPAMIALMAGTGVAAIDAILPAATVVERLVAETVRSLAG